MAPESQSEDHDAPEETPPEEIVCKLRQVDVLVAQGTPVADAIRAIGVTEVGCGTSCWMARSSTHSEKLRSSSRAGDDITILFGRMPLWATGHPLRRCSCRPSRPGRLRSPGPLRRPGRVHASGFAVLCFGWFRRRPAPPMP